MWKCQVLSWWLSSKESSYNAGDTQEMYIQLLGQASHGEGNGNALQYSCLGNSWTEELDGLQSMLSQTVGHNLVTEQQKTQANGRWERNHFIFHKIERGKVKCLLLSPSVTPWTTAYKAPLSMEFSRHEYWSRLPFPSADK